MLTKTNLMCDCNVIHENKVKESKKNMIKLRTIEDMSNFFKILGEPTRIKILNTLDNNEMCVCDIANVLNMTKSTISFNTSLFLSSKQSETKIIFSHKFLKLFR